MKSNWADLWQTPEALAYILNNRGKGNLDPAIFHYPNTHILRTENGNGTALLYLPTHVATIVESAGWAPDISAAEKAEAGITALGQIEQESWALGIREIYYVCSDQRTDQFCEERLGYERLTCMRKRLAL